MLKSLKKLNLCFRLNRTFCLKTSGEDESFGGKIIIDLRSDTITKPSAKMRESIMKAEVGDDVLMEDPTVKKLEEMTSLMFDKEAALLVPTGTMGNLIAVMSHSKLRGSEIIMGDRCHIFKYEQGGISQIAGVMPNLVSNDDQGTFSIEECLSRIRDDNIHYPITSAICIENTHNLCGGKVLPQNWIDDLCFEAGLKNIPVHMDGARVWNAHVASNIELSRITKNCYSCCVCLSKSLGAPIGSILLGPNEFIKNARRIRKVLGGGMRQAGIVAAPGIIALDEGIKRLQEDHMHAKQISEDIDNLSSELASTTYTDKDTNILMVQVNIPSKQFAQRLNMVTASELKVLKERIHILCLPLLQNAVRFVTHCDLSPTQVEYARKKLQYLLANPNEFHLRKLQGDSSS